MNKDEIIKVLNTLYDAVDGSKFGPVQIFDPNQTKPIYSGVALEMVRSLIVGVVPKGVTVEDKPEEWKGAK